MADGGARETAEGRHGDGPPANPGVAVADRLGLEEALTAKLGKIVPEPKKRELIAVVHEVVASFEGPIPAPSILRSYDEIVPGAAERIIAMAERE